jgi:hypothetical protein
MKSSEPIRASSKLHIPAKNPLQFRGYKHTSLMLPKCGFGGREVASRWVLSGREISPEIGTIQIWRARGTKCDIVSKTYPRMLTGPSSPT